MHPLSAYDIVQSWERGQERHLVDRALLLLSLATPEVTVTELAQLSIGQRNARLLALREQTLGDQLTGLARCPQCHDEIEFSVPLSALHLPEAKRAVYQLTVDNLMLRFRLPDSRDLAAVVGLADLEAARSLLIERCVVEATRDGVALASSDLPDSIIPLLSEAVLEHDPQTETRFRLRCSACEHEWSVLFDIVSFFWAELAAMAQRLLAEVTVLASAFGWHEGDILMMSSRRRQFYLEAVGER